MKRDRRNILILILVIIVVLLLGLIGYVFLIKPAINGLIIQGYNQGVTSSVTYLMQQAATCQPIPVSIGNQTVNLIAVECLQ